MTTQAGDGAQLYRRIALLATGLAIGLITLGGVVRITGSGMGCGDHWPLCNGRLLPNLADTLEVIEWSHRWVAAMLSAAIMSLAVIAWKRHRADAWLLNPALTAAALLVLQVLLGAVTVKLGTAAPAVVIHLGNAMLLLAALTIAVLRSGERVSGLSDAAGPAARGALSAVALSFVVVLFGAFVANYDAGLYCLGFPLCAGALAPPITWQGKLQWIHRLFAFLLVGHTIGLAFGSRRKRGAGVAAYSRSAWVLALLVVAQIGIAASMILRLLPPTLRAAHLLVGSLIWVATLVLAFRSRRLGEAVGRLGDQAVGRLGDQAVGRLGDQAVGRLEGEAVGQLDEPAVAPRPSIARDLITLTKPRIISLLLLTTIAPMYITGQGVPPFSLVLWVLVAGYLMAGGANTVNMWFDQDIDQLMARTKLRPIPSGRIPSWAALTFGLAQGAVAFWMFWRFVNPLSAWMALSGYMFYVIIYTIWLKRLTSQNIVIGGAAGAFPPLVGWTAMTGSLDLAALYLFAIIFFWTPPHFWALALIKRQDYAKAGIPMMPVVVGEHWTKVQMLAYTLMLIPLTIMPTVFGALGLFYAGAALLLGGRLLWLAIRVLREVGVSATTWKMYKFSLLYLALLFLAMGLDRAIPFGHGFERAPVLILDKPETEAMAPMEGMEH